MSVRLHPVLCAALGTGLSSFWALPSARADLHLAIGSRFEPLRYTSPYFPNTSGIPSTLFGNSSGSFQSTSLNPYLGLFFAQRYGVLAALDIAYGKLSGETQKVDDAMATRADDSYFQFGFSLGFKYYISPPRPSKIAPYVYADFFKYFASISTNNAAVNGEQASAQASMRSPIGASAAFGAEYFLGSGFSIGSEIFGLRVSSVSAEYRGSGDLMASSMDQTRRSASFTQVSFYTGITLNFRFQVAASVRVTEEDNEDKGGRSHPSSGYAPPPVAPTPAPPPPEAVD